MSQPRTARPGLAYLWAILGFCLIAILAIFLRLKGPAGGDANEIARREVRLENLEAVRKDAEEKLQGAPSWANKEKGIVRIPIDQAIQLTVADLKAKGGRVEATTIEVSTIATTIVPPQVKKARDEAAAAAEEASGTTPPSEPSTTPAPASEVEAAPAESPAASPATTPAESPAATPSN